jgi:uncharacterized DUF497 family protein
MEFDTSGFDWDEGNRSKCRRHGLSIAEIETVLRGELQVAPDPTHSQNEERLIAIGRTAAGRPVFIAFTMRLQNGLRLVRPITARYMHAREIRRYETAGS